MNAKLGRLEGIVYSARKYHADFLRGRRISGVQEVFALYVFAPLMLTKALVHKNRKGSPMSVVFLGSVSSHRGQSGASSYFASKGAVNALGSSLVAELGWEGNRFDTVVAGLVDAELSERIRNRLGSATWNSLINRHPLGRGGAEDIANVLVFLLSKKFQRITGTQFVIDEGSLSC